VLLSTVLLLVMLPVLLLVALAVKLDSRGPVLFRQKRFGRDMREFSVMKFRTMRHGASEELHKEYIRQLMAAEADEDTGLKKLTRDPRVTRVGAFLRRTSLDELPQLLNVVLGQMSLVGPRPALAYELEHYEPAHFERFAVRPGLTGLWQVSGRSELGFREMLDLDAAYAREAGPRMDLQILARTPITLVRRHAA
jgi:lipopolysaccharide/colanic/teichoic acid biosynthesis glycosyltransferase